MHVRLQYAAEQASIRWRPIRLCGRGPAVQPGDRPIAETLMHVAQLSPGALETLMLAVIERPGRARERMAGLGDSDEDAA